MLYNIKPGDTLLLIASNMTLSGAYAPALGELNQLYADVDGSGVTSPFDVTADLSAYGFKNINIPDTWLRAGVATGSGAGASQPLPQWLPIAVIAALLLLG